MRHFRDELKSAIRRRYKILMEKDKPVGGDWNYDDENRGSFPKAGPNLLPAPIEFKLARDDFIANLQQPEAQTVRPARSLCRRRRSL